MERSKIIICRSPMHYFWNPGSKERGWGILVGPRVIGAGLSGAINGSINSLPSQGYPSAVSPSIKAKASGRDAAFELVRGVG